MNIVIITGIEARKNFKNEVWVFQVGWLFSSAFATIQGASHPTMLLETMSGEKAQHLSIKALRLLGRKEATWSLKPKGRKSTGDSKNQKRNREAAGEGPHPWKQRVKIRKSQQQPESYLRAKQEQQHLYHTKKKKDYPKTAPQIWYQTNPWKTFTRHIYIYI